MPVRSNDGGPRTASSHLRVGLLGSTIVLSVVAASLSNCGRHAAPVRSATTARDSASVPPAAPHDLGPPIGRSDPLINGIASQLEPWVAMWRKALPEFQTDSLFREGTGPAFRAGRTESMEDIDAWLKSNEASRVISAESPGGRYTLVFDVYLELEKAGGRVLVGGEPESSPLLLDRRTGTSNTFEFCGTSCGYQWGCWIDSVRFVLAGWRDGDETNDMTVGTLGVYSLADSSSTFYATRALPTTDWQRCRDAWQAWVEQRYRKLKASRPRS
jgi:hypothetical protein